tara:strand:+ start:437 stop:730 length:294 start_codon:yes stop_codon:yes gene_type:complete
MICGYLKTNPKILDDVDASKITNWENGKDLKSYIDEMEKTSTWGGAIEIKCFCELFKISVNVKHKNRVIKFTPKHKETSRGIATLIYTGNHYEPEKN